MMSYGLKNESTAVQMYTKYMHFIGHKVTTYRSGLVVDQRCFWRGASPGRKVFDRFVTERCSKHPTSFLEEVKCLGKRIKRGIRKSSVMKKAFTLNNVKANSY